MAATGLLVTDLDGTLLRSDHALDGRTRDTLARAGAAGIVRIVATGRSLHSARRVLPLDAPIDYLAFSSGAGAVAWGRGKRQSPLFSHHLPAASVARALAFAVGEAMDVMVHAPPPDSHRFGYHARGDGHPDLQRRVRSYAGHAWPMGTGPDGPIWQGAACQLVALPAAGDPAAVVERARRTLSDLQVIRTTSPIDRTSLWLEIFPGHVSKARAAQWFAQWLGVAAHRTAAVGNDFNDADLLAWAHTSAVVANAPPALRERHAVVAHHDAGGAAELIERFLTTVA